MTTVLAVEGDITGVSVLFDSLPRGGGVNYWVHPLMLLCAEGFRTFVGVKSGRGGPADICWEYFGA